MPAIETTIRIGFDALADCFGVRPHISAEIDDMDMLRLVARELVGLTVVPPIVVKDQMETGEWVEVERLP